MIINTKVTVIIFYLIKQYWYVSLGAEEAIYDQSATWDDESQ